MFDKFDGSGREPRPVQLQILKFLEDNWADTDVFFIKGPVGSGKSAISRAVQIATDAAIITPSNILVSQYASTYPKVNFLKGKQWYTCKSSGMDCKTWQDIVEKPCSNCEYSICKGRAMAGFPTFYNPLSLYYAALDPNFTRPDVLVVDEAHTLTEMISLMYSRSFKKSEYDFPEDVVSAARLTPWLERQIDRLNGLFQQYRRSNTKKASAIKEEMDILKVIAISIDSEPENYCISISDTFIYKSRERILKIAPLNPPKEVLSKVISSKKCIFMSGTLFESDIKNLAMGRKYKILDAPSPIPRENRPILYKPVDYQLNWNTEPSLIVKSIEKVLDENPGLNTIIHVSYAMSKKLAPLFSKEIIFNDDKNKEVKVKEFIKNGGIFLAAGCAEGLDLKDDLCRLNIIPKLLFPNLQDELVKKKKARTGGELWYLGETFKILIQQAGRSTRGMDDWSKIYVLDPAFPRVFNELNKARQLPQSFIESIVWKIGGENNVK